MNADARWENQAKNVIRFTFGGDWNWHDFYEVFDQRDPSPPEQRICYLLDLRAVTSIPTDAILHLRQFAKLAEQVSGLIIIIATSVHAVMMFRLFVTVYQSVGAKFRLVADDDEAFAILQMPA